MTKRPPPEVRAYLDALPETHRKTLLRLRDSILKALPGASERISYKLPAFEKDGRVVVWMAAFRDHCSFFGAYAGARVAREHPGPGFVVKGSTIQFPPGKPPPATLVRRVVRARLEALTGTRSAPSRARKARSASKRRRSRGSRSSSS